MTSSRRNKSSKSGQKVRVHFRRNRSAKPRSNDLTTEARQVDDHEVDTQRSESVVAKGDLSRQRTIIVGEDQARKEDQIAGVVIAMRGLYANVDDGDRIVPCTIRRVLRTRSIDDRHPVTVGDRVHFSMEQSGDADSREGVIEEVEPRRGILRRLSGRKLHTIVANVDQVIIVTSAAEPYPKPHLVDRYIVAALFGEITPVICMNKIDLDEDGAAAEILERYEQIGYQTLQTSFVTGEGIDELREALRGNESGITGQSGVGKSSLLNAVQPGLSLRVGKVADQTQKGRHTTTTAELIRLDIGGYVVDTPGIRSFDVSPIPSGELEAYFAEFVDRVAGCKYPDCTHTHEINCAIKDAVEAGEIHPDRYESFITLFDEAKC